MNIKPGDTVKFDDVEYRVLRVCGTAAEAVKFVNEARQGRGGIGITWRFYGEEKTPLVLKRLVGAVADYFFK